jgi:serine/threonine-protein kinase
VPIEPGSIVGGKYRVAASIGRGGMGEVFSARRLDDGTMVAMKVVSRRVVDDTLMARLEREAVAARRVKSMYVPEVYDVDRTEEGELYLVMRLLHGTSLSQRMRDRGVLSWAEVRPIAEDVLQGLADAHAAGIVHRDLKPGNVFLEAIDAPTIPHSALQPIAASAPAPQRAFILDFGVCKLDASDGEKLTVTGESVGTVTYMAPEQIRGASTVDGRADLYSVALILFEALCGRLPFDATTQMAILAEKLEHKPKRLRDFAQVSVPEKLDALLAKGLARKPEERFGSAMEMLRAIRLLGAPTEPPRVIGPVPPPNGLPSETVLTAVSQPRTPTLGSRAGVVVAAVAAGAAVLVLLVLLRDVVSGRRPEPEIVSASTTTATTTSSTTTAPTPTVTSTVAVPLDIDDLADAAPPSAAGTLRPAGGKGIRRPPPPATGVSTVKKPQPSATHITTQPRY